MKRSGSWCAQLLLAAAVLALSSASVRAAAPTIASFTAGIAGELQAGRWAPFTLKLEAGEAPFDGQVYLEATDGDGVPYRIPAADHSIHLEPRAKRQLLFHFKPAALDNELRLIFTEADGATTTHTIPLEKQRALSANERLFLSVGPALGIADAFRDSADLTGPVIRTVELADLSALPEQALGFDAVDTLFVATSSSEPNAAWLENPAQAQALATWVRRGGRLVLGIGREAAAVLAPEHPLAQFIPGHYESQVTLRPTQTQAWEQYAGSRRPLPAADDGEARLRAPLVADFQGKIEAPSKLAPGQPPFVARAPFGLGEVVFIAADLDLPPFADWSGRANILRRAARVEPTGDNDQSRAATSRTAIHYDLVEQLRQALEVFPGVRLAPFYWVALLVLGYIALIGPADYNLLRRFLQRMEWTWITFPLLVLLTSLGAYQLAATLKGDQLQVNQVDVIDVDAAGNLRGTMIANIFSPRMSTYDLALRPLPPFAGSPQDARALLSGFALQPAALAANSERTAVIPLAAESYAYSPALDRLTGLPIHIWSTKAVNAQWFATAAPPVEADLTRSPHGQLQGTLRLTGDLRLEDCWLIDGDYVARLGDLKPGETVPATPTSGGAWNKLSSQLSYQRRVKKIPGKEELGVVGTPWDPESTDVREILRQIIFYDAAGGPAYTRAWNGALRPLDLSEQRDLGHAILVGFIPQDSTKSAPSQLLNNNDPLPVSSHQRQAILRILLPIQEPTPADP